MSGAISLPVGEENVVVTGADMFASGSLPQGVTRGAAALAPLE